MNQRINASLGLNAATLSLACLAHMEQEEAMLSATLDSLRCVRTALMHGDLSALNEALDRQAHTARAANELRLRRAELRRGLAATLGVSPQSVTLQMLAVRFPGEVGQRLEHCRERLGRLATEVDQLNRGNAALVQYSLDFLHRFLVEITGGVTAGARYSFAGVLEEAACGSMIEAKG
jgi:hypothetical protein